MKKLTDVDNKYVFKNYFCYEIRDKYLKNTGYRLIVFTLGVRVLEKLF